MDDLFDGAQMASVVMGRFMVGVVVGWRGFGKFCAVFCIFQDVDFGGGDAAAVYFFDLERCTQIEGGCGFVEDLGIDSGVDERS